MICNIWTQSDQDFIRAFVLRLPVADWAVGTLYLTNDKVAASGRVWKALANNTGITPGTDGTKWVIDAAPAVDLTGSTLLFMARSPAASTYAPLSVTSAAGGDIDITDAAGGAFTFKLPFAQLSKLPAGKYSHSLIRIRPDGEREKQWSGDLVHVVGPTR